MAATLVHSLLFWDSLAIYLVTISFFATRLVANMFLLKEARWEDVSMFIASLSYTTSMVLINITTRLATVGFPSSRRDIVLNMYAEQFVLITIFAIKMSVVSLLYRLTNQMNLQRILLASTAACVLGGLIALEILFYGALCKPFPDYQSVPAETSECTTRYHFSTWELIIDIASTLLIIGTASSIACQSNLLWKRMIVILGISFLSLYTVVSAICKRFYRNRNPGGYLYWLWTIMEMSTAMWISNGIYFWPVFQMVLHCRPFTYSRFSHTIQSPNEGQEIMGPDPIRHTTSWWKRMVAALNPRRVGDTVEDGIELTGHTRTTGFGARHAASASQGTTIMMHSELSTYLEGYSNSPHVQSLARDEDAGPALAYRAANHIQ